MIPKEKKSRKIRDSQNRQMSHFAIKRNIAIAEGKRIVIIFLCCCFKMREIKEPIYADW